MWRSACGRSGTESDNRTPFFVGFTIRPVVGGSGASLAAHPAIEVSGKGTGGILYSARERKALYPDSMRIRTLAPGLRAKLPGRP